MSTQVLNLAPTNWRDADLWVSRTHVLAYHHDDSTVSGAVAYAFRRTPELERIVASAATCVNLVRSLAHLPYRRDKVVEWESAGCKTLLQGHADHLIVRATRALFLTMPLVALDSISYASVRATDFYSNMWQEQAHHHRQVWPSFASR